MTKVLCLILPAGFKGCQAHDPLHQPFGLDFELRSTVGTFIPKGKDGSKEIRWIRMNMLLDCFVEVPVPEHPNDIHFDQSKGKNSFSQP